MALPDDGDTLAYIYAKMAEVLNTSEDALKEKIKLVKVEQTSADGTDVDGLATADLVELQFNVQIFGTINSMTSNTMSTIGNAYQTVTNNLRQA